jgi:hypothetical protein
MEMRSIILATLLLLPITAQAQRNCFPADKFAEAIASQYKEAPIGRGTSSQGYLIQFWVGESTVTVTFTRAFPHPQTGQRMEVTCIIADAENWEWINWELPLKKESNT